MKSNQFSTPIIFIIFNRPDVTRQSFDIIRSIAPKDLYVIADGPRPHIPNEQSICEQTRSIINSIDWECNLLKDYSSVNLGCGKRVSSGISNAFKIYNKAIIIEDDIIASPTFFEYCKILLDRYENNSRIMHISGTNILGKEIKKYVSTKQSYCYSQSPAVWGWATWKRAWEMYDFTMSTWSGNIGQYLSIDGIHHDKLASALNRSFQDTHDGKIDTWDYQWHYTILSNRGFSITPTTNLISNIGFSKDATHTTDLYSPLANLHKGNIQFPLPPPPTLNIDTSIEKAIIEVNYGLRKQSIFSKWKKSIKKRLHKE